MSQDAPGGRVLLGGAVLLRLFVVGCSAAALLTAVPVGAAPGCRAPASGSAGANQPPLVRVTEANDAAHPVEVRYAHASGANVYHRASVAGELVRHRVQVHSRGGAGHLWVRAEFSQPVTDVDLYVYDGDKMVGWSESSNNAVRDEVDGIVFYKPDTGGPGFENVNGLRVPRCRTLTVVTENSLVVGGTPVRLMLWLGPPGTGGHD